MAKQNKPKIPTITKKEFDAAYKSVDKKNPEGYIVYCYTYEDGRVVMTTGKIRNKGHSDYIPYKVDDTDVTENKGKLYTKVFYEKYLDSVTGANSNRDWYNRGKPYVPDCYRNWEQ